METMMAKEAMAQQVIKNLLIHILFTDKFQCDHHFIFTLALDEHEAEDQKAINAKAREKAKGVLKNALESSIQILTEKEYLELGYLAFYIIFQNGTRKYCCIYAKTPDEAINSFKQRIPDILAFSIFGKSEGQDLKTSGEWKRIPLETHIN